MLTCVLGTDAGKAVRLAGVDGKVLIGRGEDCGMVLRDEAVSQRHAAVVSCVAAFSGSLASEYRISDLGSVQGTFVNGQAVLASEPRTVRPGDVIHLGKWPAGATLLVHYRF